MAGSRRKRTAEAGPRRRSLRFPIDPGFVDRAVEEGVLMTRTALTMATMNHIIIGALRLDREYDASEVAAFIDSELRQLTLEQASMAAHMRRLMVEFPPRLSKSSTISDHHLLVQRRVIYSALASELERLRGDGNFVERAVDASQKWAWSELSQAIEARLLAVPGPGRDSAVDPAVDPLAAEEYRRERGERMRAVREVDLAALAARDDPA